MSASASSRSRFVVDASVAVKWHLPDEPDVEPAAAVLADYREGRVALIAPSQLRYEVPSAIRNAVRTNRVTPSEGRSAITNFLAWRVPTVADDEMIEAGYGHSLRFNCSLYDGLYVALASILDCPLIHADQRLANALGPGFPGAIWLGDYLPAG
jgi:predicted nucleic acid-binding protein